MSQCQSCYLLYLGQETHTLPDKLLGPIWLY